MSASSTAAWDLYREIHKAMRFALFGVTAQAASVHVADDAAVTELVEEWRRVRFVLDGHHEHEDRFCDPIVRQHVAHLRDELEAGHREADAGLVALDAAAAALAAAPAAARGPLALAFHLDLADFTALYLRHLRFEESQVMPALNRALPDAALEALTNEIRGSVAPPDMCVFIRYMAPAMNFDERLDMLGGMHRFAPPEIFEMFRAAAQDALAPADYCAVAEAAGFA